MALHARNIAVQAGASGEAIDFIVKNMVSSQNVTIDNAKRLLNSMK
jgi:hydroxymethylglutaryl-CoA reductase